MEAMLAEERRSVAVTVIYAEGNFVEFKLPVTEAEPPEVTLERVFAGFNAGSRQEVPEFGIARVRSLSVDDFVLLNGKAWKCEGAGWSVIALDQIEVAINENARGPRGVAARAFRLAYHPEWPCIQDGKRPTALRLQAIEPSFGSSVLPVGDDLPAEVVKSSGPKLA